MFYVLSYFLFFHFSFVQKDDVADDATADQVNEVFGEVHRSVENMKVVETIQKESQEYYSALSKLGKGIERHLIPDLSSKMEELLELVHLDDGVIYEGVAQHLLHTGMTIRKENLLHASRKRFSKLEFKIL